MTDDHEPTWLGDIRTRVEQVQSEPHRPVATESSRLAAVLVLLIDNDDEPEILLTERASRLATYPGTLVFPGGSAESSDDGPVETALREAAEEIGVDPASIDIIGSLPPHRLSQTGFLVTPVIGWCANLAVLDAFNVDEVAAVRRIRLREFSDGTDLVRRSPATEGNASTFNVEGVPVGAMTSIVIDWLVEEGCERRQPRQAHPGHRQRNPASVGTTDPLRPSYGANAAPTIVPAGAARSRRWG